MHAVGVFISLGIAVIMVSLATDSHGVGRAFAWSIAALSLLAAVLEARKTRDLRSAQAVAQGE